MAEGDSQDRLTRRVLWSMPSGLYVLGAAADGRFNGMTLNLAIQVSMQPRRIAVAVVKNAFTKELIDSSGVFCLNILDRADRTVVRKFVKPVDYDAENQTLNTFRFRPGVTAAPILDIALAWIDCRVHQAIDAGDHTLYIGNVVDAGFREAGEGTKVLRMEDTRMNYGG